MLCIIIYMALFRTNHHQKVIRDAKHRNQSTTGQVHTNNSERMFNWIPNKWQNEKKHFYVTIQCLTWACCLNIQSSRTVLWKQRKMFTWLIKHRAILRNNIFRRPPPTYSKANGGNSSHPAGRGIWEWGPLTHQSRRESRPPGKQLSQ